MALNLPKLPILFLLLSSMILFPFVEPQALKSPANAFAKTLQNLRGVHKGQKVKGVGTLRSYLQHFGYLANGDSSNDNFDEIFESAIKDYQGFHHLHVTGVVDDETIKTLSLPRCGVPDIVTNPNPNPNPRGSTDPENYSFFPGSPRWRKWALTYALLSGATVSTISGNAVRQAMQNALQKWAQVSNFTFTEIGRTPADIVYGFHRGNHGDGYPFDGPGRVLAHAFSPQDGRLHYDADEQWNSNDGSNVDFETVTLHELGHIFGLGHSNVTGAVMFPTYAGLRRFLSQDDIDGIRALYGF
ncbi:hypothetical protein JHK84_052025 [Glycine max]|nr:metalloendoproteinase 5-MMP-like [Glycine soja]KAG5081987.1 hypothetical protein JHK84_052025 [Glycine max]